MCCRLESSYEAWRTVVDQETEASPSLPHAVFGGRCERVGRFDTDDVGVVGKSMSFADVPQELDVSGRLSVPLDEIGFFEVVASATGRSDNRYRRWKSC